MMDIELRVCEKTRKLVLQCPDQSCHFGSHQLPINVVDDQLYKNPPTILIGTVDKFAQISWKNEPKKFFGIKNEFKPPSLIIQDELHLISGPLGSVVGHYEYLLMRMLCKEAGFTPKIVGSTATIKAGDRVKKFIWLPS